MRFRDYCYWGTLLLLLLLCGCRTRTLGPGTDQPDIVFLQINDVYEIAPLNGGKVGGMARVASLRQQLFQQTPHVFTVMAGDFLNPSVMGTIKVDGKRLQGQQMVAVMNATGVDYAVFGNHEFDLKEADLLDRIEASEFDWIASNVLHRTETGLAPFTNDGKSLPKSRLLLAGDYKIGIIGLTLENNEPDYVDIAEVYQGAQIVYDSLSAYADIMIAITHLSIDEDRELARRLPGLRLIMGGHEHEAHYERIGEVIIAKADANAKSAYVHSLHPKRRSGQIPAFQSKLIPMDTLMPLHPGVDSLVHAWEEKAYGQLRAQGFAMQEVVTVLPEPLDGRESSMRQRPTNLGKVIAEAMFEAGLKPDCAVFNSGSVRLDDQLSGAVTQFDIIRTLPFGGEIYTVIMQGSLLAKVMQVGLSNKGSGGYLQSFRIEAEGTGWNIGGAPLRMDQPYRVAIPAFLMSGREDGLDFLTAENPEVIEVIQPAATSVARDIRLALVEYLKKR